MYRYKRTKGLRKKVSRRRPYNRATWGCYGTKEVIPTILLHFSQFVQQFHRNWTKRFSYHTVINLKRKLQIFCYKMLVLGNIHKKPHNKINNNKYSN